MKRATIILILVLWANPGNAHIPSHCLNESIKFSQVTKENQKEFQNIVNVASNISVQGVDNFVKAVKKKLEVEQKFSRILYEWLNCVNP